MLGDELTAYALKMAEIAESNRINKLETQYKYSDTKLATDSANEEVVKLEEKLQIIPEDIQQRMKSAKRCWVNYYSKKQELTNAGYLSSEVKEKMKAKAVACANEDNVAKNRLNSYMEDIRSRLTAAHETKSQAMVELQTTKNTIAKRVSYARAIEDKAFTPTSATVLASLLETDRGVRAKYYLVTLLLVTLECLPFILKLIAGRTPIGERIADDRKESRIRRSMVLAEAEHERCITNAILVATQDACVEVLGSVEGRTYFAEVFASYMMALAPTGAVTEMMRDIERQQADVNDFIRRYPRYASVIAEAWTQAIKQTLKTLQGASASLG